MQRYELSVIVPTFNRPNSLRRAVESLFAQTYAQFGFTIIIVDNTPEASAAETIASLQAACPDTLDIICLHEPWPGVANARNCAMQAVKSDLVAFLDDDQSAPLDWLQRLLDNYARFGAAATFGPVRTELPDPETKFRTYFEAFFARDPDHESGYLDTYYGCGNALIDFAQIPGGEPWFDTTMNETGGEDDVLFRRIADLENGYAWAADAPVKEHPLARRVQLNYTLRRAFSYGQGPVCLAYLADPRQHLSMAFWISVGLVKLPLAALKWLVLWLLRRERRVYALDEAYRALGKIIWFVDVHSYGTAALSQKMPKLTWIQRTRPSSATKAKLEKSVL